MTLWIGLFLALACFALVLIHDLNDNPKFVCDACKQTRFLEDGFSKVEIDLDLQEFDGEDLLLPLNLRICGTCFHA